ncbi:MAG: DUF6273 domain-containing protein, partial [Lachnospiraceae bacterium]|nr:DUF6273 domain-containing protein [Lachnospiraceae bacterium]
MKKTLFKRITSFLLAPALIVGSFSVPEFSLPVHAESETIEKNANNTGLITDYIDHPNTGGYPGHYGGEWSYVYYGKYDTKPVKYRVLNPREDSFKVEGDSLFLDCDNVLNSMVFSSESKEWPESDLNSWLNREFLSGFTRVEQSSIAESYKDSPSNLDYDNASDFMSLSGEKVFVLDEAEVCSGAYGYLDDSGNSVTGVAVTRLKKDLRGNYCSYWLRTAGIGLTEAVITLTDDRSSSFIVCVSPEVTKCGNIDVGVSPAFNVKLSSIIFATKISADKEYKLTLKDDNLKAGVTQGSQIERNGNVLTIPYSVEGDPNRLSILITYKH